MFLESRFREIEEFMEAELEESELEGGHEPVVGGSETPPPEEADELTHAHAGEAGEVEDLGEAEVPVDEDVYMEPPPDAEEAPQEVEGFEETTLAPGPMEAAEVVLERVFGSDDRVRVWNTSPYPWRTICHLDITTAFGTKSGCTGAFIGPRVVLTAGHCVYMHSKGGWVNSIKVTPGANSSLAPYGSAVATYFITVKGWINDKSSNYDYAVIVLPSNKKLGNTVGWMGLANLSFWSLLGLNVNSSGYPGDKPYKTQWWNANSILAVTDRRLYYRIDTYGGQSGSPVWRYKNGQRHIVGIHTTGSSVWNGATRIVKPVFDNLVNWKAL